MDKFYKLYVEDA